MEPQIHSLYNSDKQRICGFFISAWLFSTSSQNPSIRKNTLALLISIWYDEMSLTVLSGSSQSFLDTNAPCFRWPGAVSSKSSQWYPVICGKEDLCDLVSLLIAMSSYPSHALEGPQVPRVLNWIMMPLIFFSPGLDVLSSPPESLVLSCTGIWLCHPWNA